MRIRGSAGLAWVCLVGGSAMADHTQTIMITGYWPPTNNMIRPFSQSPTQNPGGWQGQNWEGRGYNIVSYFPEFPGISGPPYGEGAGDFRVDYQHASDEFWRITSQIHPVAIITFSRGSAGSNWEIESRHRKLPLNQWAPDYEFPQQPTPELPIASEPDFNIRMSSLPMQQIANAVNGAGLGVPAFIDTSNDFGGNFVSEFTGYHSTWYENLHASPSDPAWCVAGGHIHVGGDTSPAAALAATQVTLRALTTYLNTVIPAPAGAAVLGLGAVVLGNRRRRV